MKTAMLKDKQIEIGESYDKGISLLTCFT